MSYSPVGNSLFTDLSETGLNADSTATVSSSLDIGGAKTVFFSVAANTGTHASHIVTLQCSADGSSWSDTSSTLTGVGAVDNISIAARHVRLKVTTAEGASSTIDIVIQAK